MLPSASCHPLNTLPSSGSAAVTVTLSPSLYTPPPVPPFIVTVYSISPYTAVRLTYGKGIAHIRADDVAVRVLPPLEYLAFFGLVRGYRDAFALFVYAAASAAVYLDFKGRSLFHVPVICLDGNISCGHCEGRFRARCACKLDCYACRFASPLVKDFALGCFPCGDRNRIAVMRGRFICRAVRDGYGIVDIFEHRCYGNIVAGISKVVVSCLSWSNATVPMSLVHLTNLLPVGTSATMLIKSPYFAVMLSAGSPSVYAVPPTTVTV